MITKSRGKEHEIPRAKHRNLVPASRVLFVISFIVIKSIRVLSIKKQFMNFYFRK